MDNQGIPNINYTCSPIDMILNIFLISYTDTEKEREKLKFSLKIFF